jgi:hypothetical protein
MQISDADFWLGDLRRAAYYLAVGWLCRVLISE